MNAPKCRKCGDPMVMPESVSVGICMACRPWFVRVDPTAAGGDLTSVKCWCGHVTTWGHDQRQPRSCSQCAARFEFQ